MPVATETTKINFYYDTTDSITYYDFIAGLSEAWIGIVLATPMYAWTTIIAILLTVLFSLLFLESKSAQPEYIPKYF